MMPKAAPDHHDAELVIKLYELRREPVMRDSRSAINTQYLPKNESEALAVVKTDHPLNAAFRQTGTYWEMAYGMVKHGVLHGDFMMESCGEGLFLLARVEPYLEAIRKNSNPFLFLNAEWIVANVPRATLVMERMRKRVEAMLATAKVK